MTAADDETGDGAGDADTGADADTDGDSAGGSAVSLAFDDNEYLPAVAQDADSGDVLMLAYVTREAFDRTRETGLAHYYSRSRDELWQKGQSSGHVQRIEDIRVDCDGDALLYRVHQDGGACHTGFESCFHRRPDGDVVGERVFDPDDVY